MNHLEPMTRQEQMVPIRTSITSNLDTMVLLLMPIMISPLMLILMKMI